MRVLKPNEPTCTNEYLKKVGKAIVKRELTLDEARFACQMPVKELKQKLTESIPFNTRIESGITHFATAKSPIS